MSYHDIFHLCMIVALLAIGGAVGMFLLAVLT